MATSRNDISILACYDEALALCCIFTEQDEEFYGSALEDLETPMVVAEYVE